MKNSNNKNKNNNKNPHYNTKDRKSENLDNAF